MATPARRTEIPGPSPAGPVPVLAPVGWMLTLGAGITLILASWLLYPTDYDGMWAGYRDGFIGTVVIVASMVLRTTLPKRPVLGLLGLLGIALVLFAVFVSEGTDVFVVELVAGIALLVGTAFQAGSERR